MTENIEGYEPDPGGDRDYSEETGPEQLRADSEADDNGNQKSDSTPPSPEKKLSSQETVSSFFQLDEVKDKVALISSSPMASFKTPLSNYHKIVNILSVSRNKKIKDLQAGSQDCEILTTYRQWIASPNTLLANIKKEYELASQNLKGQTSIKDFFKKKDRTTAATNPRIVYSDKENNNDSNSTAQPVKQSSSKQQNSSGKESVLRVLGLSETEEKNIKSGLKVDEDLIRCRTIAVKIRDFYSNEEMLSDKSAWEHKESKFATNKTFVKKELNECRDLFKSVSILADKELSMQEAKELPLEEVGPFLVNRTQEANSEVKRGFLRLVSPQLLESLRELNHYMRKRMSNIDASNCPDQEIKFTCFKADSSWEDCLKHLEEVDWKPTLKGGNVKLELFYRCCELFRSMDSRGDEYLDAEDLLNCLNITERRKVVLDTLVQNLPILTAKKDHKIAVMNVSTFLQSQSLVEDLMKASGKKTSTGNYLDGVEVRAGSVPDEPRKVGSGRPRIVDANPEILRRAEYFSQSAGVAAHERRRSDIGHFGFSMINVQDFIKETCFKDNPEKTPSLSTIRRLYEAPSMARSSSRRYKGEIRARPGVKRNDETATGEAHEHSHECAASFKISREFFALFDSECNTASCDDKAKIPIGISAVHRLNSLSHKFFITGSGPNYPDHDVLRSGSLINPEGYMLLRPKPSVDDRTETVGPAPAPNLESQHDVNTPRHRSPETEENTDEIEPDFDDLYVEMQQVIHQDEDLNFSDAISQLDGAESESSEDEFDVNFLSNAAQPRPYKRSRLDSEAEDSVEERETGEEEQQHDVEAQDEPSSNKNEPCQIPDIDESRFVMKDGRKHVVTPYTGPTYVFLKSNKSKPASISRHINDLITIANVDTSLRSKPNLLLLLDDGLDWGGRGLQTLFYLGDLWLRLDLDLLVISRNAPGHSKGNPVEHFWGNYNKKVSGVTLPPKRPEQTVEAAEDESIKLLISSCLKNMKYDGHPVFNIHVPCESSIVQIGEEMLENDHILEEETKTVQKIMEDRKMDKRAMREKHPEIYDKLQCILKHVDIRLHGYVFRKCLKKDGYQCAHCIKFPTRSSDKLISCLPKKSSGGLFFDVVPDPNHPGHYKTLLDLLKEGDKIKIKPDGMFLIPFGRCEEKGCMVSFKTKADRERHFRLAHQNYKPKNPTSHICTFKVNNVPCGQSFETQWLLQKHKNADSHIVRRKRGGKS